MFELKLLKTFLSNFYIVSEPLKIQRRTKSHAAQTFCQLYHFTTCLDDPEDMTHFDENMENAKDGKSNGQLKRKPDDNE